jgi:hypothetical protein
MTKTLEQVLSELKLYSDNQIYAIIKLPPSAIMVAAGIIAEIGEPFCGLIVDKDEVTLIIPQEAVADFSSRLRGQTMGETAYRLITFDVATDFMLVGLMAALSRALADAGVTVMPYAAYTRDHILVPVEQFETAWKALEKLKR